MNNEIIFSVEESIDGGYEAKAIGFSIFSQSETYEELIDNLRDAVKCHFDKDELPKLIRIHIVKDEVFAV